MNWKLEQMIAMEIWYICLDVKVKTNQDLSLFSK